MSPYDLQHMRNTLTYMQRVKRLFFRSSDRISAIYEGIDRSVQFDMAGNPAVRRAIEKELQGLASQINAVILDGQKNEWMLGNAKMDGVLNQFTKGRTLAPAIAARWGGKNLPALAAFQARTEAGLNLSDRVWSMVRGQATNIERHLAVGIYEGTDARKLATEMKQYLNNPDALFRRVRDAGGNLRLSKAAQEFHPGQGVYRSAYKNALRLTRTETNLAYQTAENERREKMDFVLGVRVQRSSSAPYDCDICEAGVGDYPKDYDWTAWHPNCLCFSTDILPDDETFDAFFQSEADLEDLQKWDWGEPVKDIPDSMKEFMSDTGFKHYGHEVVLDGDTVGFRPAETIEEAREWAKNNLGIERDTSEINIIARNTANQRLYELRNEYKTPNFKAFGNEARGDVVASATGYEMRFNKKYFNDIELLKRKKIKAVQSGYNTFGAEINPMKSVIDHEFAHVLTQNDLITFMGKQTNIKKEILAVRREYRAAVKGADMIKNKDFISIYAHKDIDEFVAEAFTMAINSPNPSRFAIKIYDIINKYYKK